MMRQILIVLLLTGTAAAQEAKPGPKVPDFVPFVVDQRNYEAVRKHLGTLKYDDAQPVINWMDTLAAKAREQWAAENGVKP